MESVFTACEGVTNYERFLKPTLFINSYYLDLSFITPLSTSSFGLYFFKALFCFTNSVVGIWLCGSHIDYNTICTLGTQYTVSAATAADEADKLSSQSISKQRNGLRLSGRIFRPLRAQRWVHSAKENDLRVFIGWSEVWKRRASIKCRRKGYSTNVSIQRMWLRDWCERGSHSGHCSFPSLPRRKSVLCRLLRQKLEVFWDHPILRGSGLVKQLTLSWALMLNVFMWNYSQQGWSTFLLSWKKDSKIGLGRQYTPNIKWSLGLKRQALT